MDQSLSRPRREQSPAEEVANSVCHGVGLVAAILGTPFLLTQAARGGDAGVFVGTGVFSATAIFLYLASTLYHAFPAGKAKRLLQVVDHAAIFLLIAGTYTPFALGVLRGAWGWTLLGIVWGLASIGLTLKIVGKAPRPVLFVGIYLLMGWLIVIAIAPLLARMPAAGLLWLLAGGLSYTVGVVFYATDSRLFYGHVIWHLFVLAGTTCHYFAVLWYAA